MNDRFKDLKERFLKVTDLSDTHVVIAQQIGINKTTLFNFLQGKKQFHSTLLLIEEYVVRKEMEW